MRAANSIARLCAIASITKLTTVPIRLRISTGRRPQPVGQLAEQRRRKQLAERKRREEQADDERRRAERRGVERQQRDDDPEADQVDEDRKENDEEWSGHAADRCDSRHSRCTPLISTGSDRHGPHAGRYVRGLHGGDPVRTPPCRSARGRRRRSRSRRARSRGDRAGAVVGDVDVELRRGAAQRLRSAPSPACRARCSGRWWLRSGSAGGSASPTMSAVNPPPWIMKPDMTRWKMVPA